MGIVRIEGIEKWGWRSGERLRRDREVGTEK